MLSKGTFEIHDVVTCPTYSQEIKGESAGGRAIIVQHVVADPGQKYTIIKKSTIFLSYLSVPKVSELCNPAGS